MPSYLLIHEAPLLVFPSLACEIGLVEAILLNQVHYWLHPKRNKNLIDGRYWVHNTYEQWFEQFPFLSLKTIYRAFNTLVEQGYLLTFVAHHGFSKTKYYTVNYAKIQSWLEKHRKQRASSSGQFDQIGLAKLTRLYIDTEITYTDILPPLSPPSKKEEEEEFFKKLISVWNEHVQVKLHPSSPQVQLTQMRVQQLRDLLQSLLANAPEQWHAYCLKISQCRYLMGENPSGFKVTFDWALKPENAVKVLEGAIYDKPRKQPAKELTGADYVDRLKHHCDHHQYGEGWFEVCKHLVHLLGQPTFESWLKPLIPLDLTGSTIRLAIENRFACDYIQVHFRVELTRALQAIYPQATIFEIQTKGKHAC